MLVSLGLLLAYPAQAASQATLDAPAAAPAFGAQGRPRIGLVLSGGGAKGFAHIGVIEELERRHIPIDVISGTSMGAVVGSMYAIGNDAAGIETLARSIDWTNIFNDRLMRSDLTFRRKREVRDILLNFRLGIAAGKPVLPTGVLNGQKLFSLVQDLFSPWRSTEDFDALPIPFRAVASNIITGEPVVMGSGNLSTAVFASMSIPAVLPPVEREGLLLIDGGLSDNLPVDVARAMGVDVVIVVDVIEPPKASADQIKDAVDVLGQIQALLGYETVRRQRASVTGRDVLIDPDITGLSMMAFDKLETGIQRGREAAQKAGDKLSALSVSDSEWAAYLARRSARSHPAPIRIAKVEIVNTSHVRTRNLEPMVTTRPGDILDGKLMARDVAAIYALDEFDRVDYRIDIEPMGNILRVNAVGNPGSDRYFQAGVMISSNFGKAAAFDLALGFTDRDFLGTGAEWRGFGRVGSDVLFDVSLYKRFGRFFVEPSATFQRYSSLLLQQGSVEELGSLQVTRADTGIDGGMVFGNWGELRAGVRLGGINPGDTSANVGLPVGWNRDVDWRIGFTVDTLDNLSFPRSGVFAQAQFIDHNCALGGKFERNSLTINVQKPISWDRTTIVLGARFGTSSRAINDYIGEFQTGGFLNLSGLQRNSLIGSQLVLGRVVGLYRITDKAAILDLPVYVGGSLEAGNVWADRSDISFGSLRTAASAFVAVDTLIGPVWLAYGRSGSAGSVYLAIGRVF